MYKRIVNGLRQINESLPVMMINNMVYLIIGECIILALSPHRMLWGVGFFAGVLYSVFAEIHLALRIRKVVYGQANTTPTLVIGYLIRLLVMIILFAILYYFKIGDLLAALIGMFSMKVSAYLQPFTNKLLAKISSKGR